MLYFFFNDTATTEIYTLSLHDALPIYLQPVGVPALVQLGHGHALDALDGQALLAPGRHPAAEMAGEAAQPDDRGERSEEHTSELQSRQYLVCRLLLEKKKKIHNNNCH